MKLHTISASLSADKMLIFESVPEINEGENQTTVLEITIPGNLSEFGYYLEFLCPGDKKYISPRLEASNGKIEYEIENCVLKGQGYVYAQLVARSFSNNRIVFKSVKDIQAAFWVNAGINADIPVAYREDFLTKAQGIMSQMDEIKKDAESGKFTGAQGPKGDKGERGEKGDAGVVVPASGFFCFNIEDGILKLHCSDSENKPRTELTSAGELLVEV